MPYVILALAASLLLSLVGNYVQHNDYATLESEKTQLAASLETSQENARTNATAAGKWEETTTDTIAKLTTCQGDLQAIGTQNAEALATANAAAADASRTLDTFMRRYQVAADDATCARLLETPLCDGLREE